MAALGPVLAFGVRRSTLTQGKIFNQRGEMVAAVMQEGLTRLKRGNQPVRVRRPLIGVLALQGDTREHLAALREAGAESIRCAAAANSMRWTGWSFPAGNPPR